MFSKKHSLNLIAKKGGHNLIGKKSGNKPPMKITQVQGAYNKSPMEK
jgi:hypothetical protein